MKAELLLINMAMIGVVVWKGDGCHCNCNCRPTLYKGPSIKRTHSTATTAILTTSATTPTVTCKSGHFDVENYTSLDWSLCHDRKNNTIIGKFNYTVYTNPDVFYSGLGFSDSQTLESVEALDQIVGTKIHQTFFDVHHTDATTTVDLDPDFINMKAVKEEYPKYGVEFQRVAKVNNDPRDFQFSPDNCPFIVGRYWDDVVEWKQVVTEEKVCFMAN